MKKNINILVLLIVSAIMTGCYHHRAIGLLQEPTKANKLPVYEKAEYEPYRLHVNDEVIYRLITMDQTIYKTISAGNANTNNGQYANSYRIHPDGTIDLPFLHPIKLVGLTEQEAQDVVRDAFREIVPDADVKLCLYNKNFTVIGEMRAGQQYIYKEKLNIYQALAMTGDLRNPGDRKHVRIIRPRDYGQEPEVLEFDIRTNTLIDSKYYYIYPNDVIYVQRERAAFFKVGNLFGFTGLITSSVALLVSVLNFSTSVAK